MSDERWSRIRALFHQLAELDVGEQELRLAALATTEPAVVGEVISLLAADRQAHRLPDRAGFGGEETALVAGETVGPYRVLAELGRGGMGIVYRGERADGAFEREVAIKVALPELLSPALGLRFAEERRILATLDHPGIAGLLDAGTTADGRLYLVLDLVEGVRLDLWAQGKPLRARLELFVAVCDAVDHAHRQLVLHRDLKPANILVTPEGQPKLLDFGIARLLGDGAAGGGAGAAGEATRLGCRLLTPEYASPEQLRGEPLSTAADVYALGVVLFELVTDRRPHDVPGATSPEERARRIVDDPPPRLPGVARDLAAIVHRALAPAAAQRYPSVAALRDDLGAFLVGGAVSARAPTFAERTLRIVRRHRVAVAVTGAFVAVLVGATAFSLRQAALTARQRDLAERRFTDLRALANSLLFEIHGAVRDLDGATQAREIIVRRALEYLERLAPEAASGEALTAAASDPGLAREVAAGYERIAEIQGALVQGSSLGRVASAAESMQRALALREALARRPGAGWEDRLSLVEVLDKVSAIALGSGDYARARPLAEREWVEASLLAAERPRDEGAQSALAAAAQRLGGAKGALGEMDAPALLATAVELRRELLAASPGSPKRQEDLAKALRLQSAHSAIPTAEAIVLVGEAIALQEALLGANPENVSLRAELIKSLLNLGGIHTDSNPEAALAPLERAGALAATTAAADPANVNQLSLRMSIESQLANAYFQLGRLDDALARQQRHLVLLERMASGPEAPPMLGRYALESFRFLGAIHLRRAARRDGVREDPRVRRRELLAARQAFVAGLAGAGDGIEELPPRDPLRVLHAETRELLAECDRQLASAR